MHRRSRPPLIAIETLWPLATNRLAPVPHRSAAMRNLTGVAVLRAGRLERLEHEVRPELTRRLRAGPARPRLRRPGRAAPLAPAYSGRHREQIGHAAVGRLHLTHVLRVLAEARPRVGRLQCLCRGAGVLSQALLEGIPNLVEPAPTSVQVCGRWRLRPFVGLLDPALFLVFEATQEPHEQVVQRPIFGLGLGHQPLVQRDGQPKRVLPPLARHPGRVAVDPEQM